MVNIEKYESHPGRPLLVHAKRVRDNVKDITDLPIVEIAAILHDIGKLNPNFQNKLNGVKSGYSSHAYLSAFIFYLVCQTDRQFLNNEYNIKEIEEIISVIAIVAHHHGNLPNFDHILNENECDKLFDFLRKHPDLPVNNFVQKFFTIENFEKHLFNEKAWEKFKILGYDSKDSLNTFLSTQFVFASLIVSDKADAGNYKKDENNCLQFFSQYNTSLERYLNQLDQTTELNKLRTEMRKKAIKNILKKYVEGKRVFSLTAPTGSGKTLMLLSLAGEILKKENGLRIIYALPFLSIVEQVEKECLEIFPEYEAAICRIDSKSENKEFAKLQSMLDEDPSAINKIISAQFAEEIFDYPFIITTFVRVFETLLSNKNATLLKLPNFANAIFLIDEIQALPPRLYGFFTAIIDVFCRKYKSYAILSTATMPNFSLPENSNHDLKGFFPEYILPSELLEFEYFQNPLFNRYKISRHTVPIEIDKLAEMVSKEKESVLIILNTIQDSKDLYAELVAENNNNNCILLNTHFTIDDRKNKINKCKQFLEKRKKVILISTQLIEAGVDIDFPIVYRDFSPIPSLVQSAGRCNRNGKLSRKGHVKLIDLQKNHNSRSKLIYKGKDAYFLNYAFINIRDKNLREPDMFDLQKKFFQDIKENTLFGHHNGVQFENGEIDFIQRIKELKFAEIGKFKLIDVKDFGEEMSFYIPQNDNDKMFEKLQRLLKDLQRIGFNNFNDRKIKSIEIKNQIKAMSGNILRVIIKHDEAAPPVSSEMCYGLFKLSREYYDEHTGIQLKSGGQIL